MSLAWFFFFSSRRRHTRCGRDWSSDVCSSDLLNGLLNGNRALTRPAPRVPVDLRELIGRAAERVGVAVHGALGELIVAVGVAPTTHALALAIDVAGGTGRGRSITVTARSVPGAI